MAPPSQAVGELVRDTFDAAPLLANWYITFCLFPPANDKATALLDPERRFCSAREFGVMAATDVMWPATSAYVEGLPAAPRRTSLDCKEPPRVLGRRLRKHAAGRR